MSKRIIDQTTVTSLSTGDYVMVDNETGGSKKYDLGSKLNVLDGEIGDLSQLDTEVKTDLVSAINEAAQSGGEGLTDNERVLILTIFSKAAYAEDDAGDAYDQLSALWSVYSVTWSGTGYTHNNTSVSARGGSTFVSTVTADGGHTISTVVATMGGVTVQGAWSNGTVTIPNVTGDIVITVTTIQAEVSSISAVYTQSGTVYETDTLDSLKTDLVVTATYVDQSTSVVPSTDYTLSGTLAEGTSTVTVTYGGKTTTFSVTVTHFADTTAQIDKEGYILAWAGGAINELEKTDGGITITYSMDNPSTTLHPAGVIPYKSSIFTGSQGEIQVLNNGVHVNYVDVVNRWAKAYNSSHTYTEFKNSWTVQTYNQIRFSVDITALDDAYMYDYTTGQVWFAGINTPYYGMSNISEAE